MTSKRERADRDRPTHAHGKPSLWEHAAAAVGAAIVVAMLAFMAYEALTAPTDPVPLLVLRVDTIVAYPSGHVVEFRAINTGQATAAAVQVEGELRADTGVVERSQSTIDFVPAKSWRKAGLVFRASPAQHRLQLRVVGYDRP